MNSSPDSRLSALRVTLARPLDLAEVHDLLDAAGQRLAARGFPNWLPAYPRDRLTTDIDEGIVRVVRDVMGTIVATFMLRNTPVHSYHGITWGDDNAKARYLNRLAVLPERHGQGIGAWCLRQIHNESMGASFGAIRCDVLQANVPLRRFYEDHGYVRRGERYHTGWHFTVYERVLRLGLVDGGTEDGGRTTDALTIPAPGERRLTLLPTEHRRRRTDK